MEEDDDDDEEGGMPGGMGGFGGLGGLLNDPSLLAAMADPEVAAAFKDITSNPANIMKYQNNPKVMQLLTKMAGKMGGMGGGMASPSDSAFICRSPGGGCLLSKIPYGSVPFVAGV